MTLAEYLSEAGIKDEAFACLVGVSRSMVTKLRHRSAKPSIDTALRIIDLSGKRIGLNDLMPVTASSNASTALVEKSEPAA